MVPLYISDANFVHFDVNLQLHKVLCYICAFIARFFISNMYILEIVSTVPFCGQNLWLVESALLCVSCAVLAALCVVVFPAIWVIVSIFFNGKTIWGVVLPPIRLCH